ncbi:uncharacterized protein LOC127798512 isoform X3 [Diospyros lotus]|uniref:uncharacterized protein LOC127798512 isoform X3 n=1 Tax=Diospyros lotus TaxID=55363 RepID=UPI00224E269C|nr:uncharacterized protein LOC127798512 isoform X3 [Diospyros lotus]
MPPGNSSEKLIYLLEMWGLNFCSIRVTILLNCYLLSCQSGSMFNFSYGHITFQCLSKIAKTLPNIANEYAISKGSYPLCCKRGNHLGQSTIALVKNHHQLVRRYGYSSGKSFREEVADFGFAETRTGDHCLCLLA